MRLNLESNIMRLREAHNTRVIAESRHDPGTRHLLRSRHDVTFEQSMNSFLLKRLAPGIHLAILDDGLECLMRTMFRLRLRQRLYLDIGWLAALLPEMALDSTHLVQVQCQQTRFAQLH